MHASQDNNQIFFRWVAPERYYQARPKTYFQILIIIGLVLSLLVYFLGEYLLIAVIWVLIFVGFVQALVPPPEVEFAVGKFGLQTNSCFVPFGNLGLFTVVKKPKGVLLLRFFVLTPQNSELFVYLPKSGEQSKEIISYLQSKIPFMERVPKTEVEKIADFLRKITGL